MDNENRAQLRAGADAGEAARPSVAPSTCACGGPPRLLAQLTPDAGYFAGLLAADGWITAGQLDGDGFISGRWSSTSSAGPGIRCGAVGTEAAIRWIAAALDARLAEESGGPVRVRRIGIEKYSFPMFEWRTSDHNAVAALKAMRAVIGDLGISRKWAALDTHRAVLAARQTKGAA